MEFLDRSMTVSARVDARALAELAKWQMKQGLQARTRSKLIALAVRQLADAITSQWPELKTPTLEQAYCELQEMNLAPVSMQAMQSMVRGLAAESLMMNHDKVGDMRALEAGLKRNFAGQGLAGHALQSKVQEQMAQMTAETQNQTNQGMENSLPDTHMGVDMVAARALLKEKQNQPLKHNWGEALEADQPGFQERYQAREQNKLSELKAGLAGGPAVGKMGVGETS